MSRPKSCRTRRPKYLSSIPAEIVHLEPRTMLSSGAVGAFIGQGSVTVLGVPGVPAMGLELSNTITSGQLGNTTAVDSNGHTVIVGYGNDATNTPRFGHFNPAGSTYEDVISVAAGHFWVSYNLGGGVFQAPVDFGAIPSGGTLSGLPIDSSNIANEGDCEKIYIGHFVNNGSTTATMDDILVTNANTFGGQLTTGALYTPASSGGSFTYSPNFFALSSAPNDFEVWDYNGDGYEDLATGVISGSVEAWSYAKNNAGTLAGFSSMGSININVSQIRVGKILGDADDYIVIRRYTTAAPFTTQYTTVESFGLASPTGTIPGDYYNTGGFNQPDSVSQFMPNYNEYQDVALGHFIQGSSREQLVTRDKNGTMWVANMSDAISTQRVWKQVATGFTSTNLHNTNTQNYTDTLEYESIDVFQGSGGQTDSLLFLDTGDGNGAQGYNGGLVGTVKLAQFTGSSISTLSLNAWVTQTNPPLQDLSGNRDYFWLGLM